MVDVRSFPAPKDNRVKTIVFCENGWTGTLRVTFYGIKNTSPDGAPVGDGLIGNVDIPITIQASADAQLVTTGNILNSNIVIPTSYFGIETNFVGANDNVEVAMYTGTVGGVLDDDFYEDDNGDGILTNEEFTPSSILYGIAPAVEIDTVSAADTLFTGTVTLDGWVGASLPNVQVSIDGTSAVSTPLVGSGNTGTFTISLPTGGSHSVKVKAATHLSKTLNGVTPGWATANFVLNAGDCNNDNIVDDFDFILVIVNFGSQVQAGDCTGDGVVDDLDFCKVIVNFGDTGN